MIVSLTTVEGEGTKLTEGVVVFEAEMLVDLVLLCDARFEGENEKDGVIEGVFDVVGVEDIEAEVDKETDRVGEGEKLLEGVLEIEGDFEWEMVAVRVGVMLMEDVLDGEGEGIRHPSNNSYTHVYCVGWQIAD